MTGGHDRDALETGLQRLYEIEHAYREEFDHTPAWIVSTRLLIEDVLRGEANG